MRLEDVRPGGGGGLCPGSPHQPASRPVPTPCYLWGREPEGRGQEATQEARAPQIGRQVPRDPPGGEGGMGRVFRGVDPDTKAVVAIKTIREER